MSLAAIKKHLLETVTLVDNEAKKPTKTVAPSKDFATLDGLLSRAQGAFQMIDEDNRDPKSVTDEVSGLVKQMRDLVGKHLAGGIEGNTDVEGDITQ